MPKNFVGEPFCAVFHKIFGSEKSMHRIGVEYQDFPSESFCLTVPRNFVGKPLSVSLLSVAEEVWIGEGVGSIKIFCRKFFVSQCRGISYGNPIVCHYLRMPKRFG